MSQVAQMMLHALGRLEAQQASEFRSLHQRLDLQDRRNAEWRHYMLRRLDSPPPPKRNGSGSLKTVIRFLQINAMLGFVIAGTLGYKQPEAFREMLVAMAAKITLGLIGGG